MGLKPPFIRDANGAAMPFGTETVTKRFASVGTGGQALSLPDSCKECMIHVESGTVVAQFTGSSTNSAEVQITADGTTLQSIPVAVEADAEIITIAAETGTIDVSVIGWR